MNSHSLASTSGRDGAARNASTRRGVMAVMSEREAQAYLLARDAVRRVRRTAPLFDSIASRPALAPGQPGRTGIASIGGA